ncbi:cytoplasmic dynein 1 intermediate chain 1-like isoform X3 [Lineus longissimus]|uniref:cytoplasmic dynein 1 intermediate chain 1-like isoform X3 n=1 Tax=Lineus longissimus TaxID=88925 RepID=UPI002B4CFB23
MSDRKKELERKKKQLQELREKKKKDAEEKKRMVDEAALRAPAAASAADPRSEMDQIFSEFGLPPTAEGGARAAPGSPAKSKSSTPSQGSQDSGDMPVPQPSPKMKAKLGIFKATQTNIPPKEMVSYSKETQTPTETHDKDDDLHSWHDSLTSVSCSGSLYGSPRHGTTGSPRFYHEHLEWDDEFLTEGNLYVLTYDTGLHTDDDVDSLDVSVTPPAHLRGMPHVEAIKPAQAEEKEEKKEEKIEVRELSEEEKRSIMMTEEFQSFVTRSTNVIERALAEDIDFLVDYAGGDGEDLESDLQAGEKLKLGRQFFDERWSKHRTVTCMDWSTQHPELLVASYNNNEESPHEPDGVALIWNIKFKKTTPEYIFHCQSAVMSTCFAKFHPNLVVGGTYSGQIVLWDNRSNKRTPVQRTPLSAAAHTHPVYCVNVVGTQNAHNLISVSTDGKMCSWSLDMLSQPQDSIELQHKQTKSVAATCFSFLSGDVNNFVVGSEEGAVYTACRHGSKAGISDMFEGHQGPVTGIDCHNVQGQIDFSQHFLTSSFDWTVKLWSMKDQKALYSFEDNSDYVYDVCWSPIHPAVFASVDGMGRLDIWNLNNETEVPTTSTYVEGNTALNRCRWHQSGHQIAVGDDMGKIHIYDLNEHIASPKVDEWTKFAQTLQEIRNNAADRDEDSQNITSPLR